MPVDPDDVGEWRSMRFDRAALMQGAHGTVRTAYATTA